MQDQPLMPDRNFKILPLATIWKFTEANRKRAALLAVSLICVMGAIWLINQNAMPWARARSGEPAATVRHSAEVKPTFQTLSDFINRSPGERGETDALKGMIKSNLAERKNGSLTQGPTQRALGKIFEPEPFGIAAAQEGPIELLSGPIEAIVALEALPLFDPARGTSSGFRSRTGALPGGGAVALGLGPGFGEGGDGSPPPSPPAVAAVPEPSIWALLMIGFFAIGFGLRRANAGAGRPGRKVAI